MLRAEDVHVLLWRFVCPISLSIGAGPQEKHVSMERWKAQRYIGQQPCCKHTFATVWRTDNRNDHALRHWRRW